MLTLSLPREEDGGDSQPVDSTDNAARDVPVGGIGQDVSITDNDHLQGRLVSLLIMLQLKMFLPLAMIKMFLSLVMAMITKILL